MPFFSSMHQPHHLRRPPRPSGSERRGARGRGSRWRRAPNARSAKEAFALGRGGRHRGRGRRGGGSTCEKVVPGVLRPTRCLAASAIAQKGRKRSGVAPAPVPVGVTPLCQRSKGAPPPSAPLFLSLLAQKLRYARRALQRLKCRRRHVGDGLAWGVARRAVRTE